MAEPAVLTSAAAKPKAQREIRARLASRPRQANSRMQVAYQARLGLEGWRTWRGRRGLCPEPPRPQGTSEGSGRLAKDPERLASSTRAGISFWARAEHRPGGAEKRREPLQPSGLRSSSHHAGPRSSTTAQREGRLDRCPIRPRRSAASRARKARTARRSSGPTRPSMREGADREASESGSTQGLAEITALNLHRKEIPDGVANGPRAPVARESHLRWRRARARRFRTVEFGRNQSRRSTVAPPSRAASPGIHDES